MSPRRVLSDDDLDRLVKFLGMTGSAHDGECLNAARMASKMLRDLGLTWAEVLTPKRQDSRWRDEVDEALLWPEALTDWEVNFLNNLREFPFLSEKQNAVLERLVAKVAAHRSAAA